MHRGTTCLFTALLACIFAGTTFAQPNDTIFDEAQVPAYVLSDPLLMQNGTKVDTAEKWGATRRGEILRLFEEHVDGRSPAPPDHVDFDITSTDANALGGKATRKQVTLYVTGKRDGPTIDLLLYLPNAAKKPVPVFLGLNFYGNHTIDADPGIKLSERWMRANSKMGVVDNRATEDARGRAANRWPVVMIVDRGYTLATVYYGDIEPDFPGGWKMGLRTAFDIIESDFLTFPLL
jgi:(4-O-methyl)-D-glucuronate---lignin esterase